MTPSQSSVWGSGIAGVVCALAALATGDYALWQVRDRGAHRPGAYRAVPCRGVLRVPMKGTQDARWADAPVARSAVVWCLVHAGFAPQIGFVASFCSKLSDTVSSEVGKAYGKTTYLITTMQVGARANPVLLGDVDSVRSAQCMQGNSLSFAPQPAVTSLLPCGPPAAPPARASGH
jgi:hypothetical protein